MGMKLSDYPIVGIDISEFNGIIDPTKLDLTGANFCAIRVGHGRKIDQKFKVNWAGCKGKMYRLPYWYMDYYSNHDPDTTANGITDANWGKLQAEVCWDALKDDPEGILFLDIEKYSGGPDPSSVKGQVITIARSFLTRFDELSGKTNGIYISLSMIPFFPEDIRQRPLWVAWYNEEQTIESVLKATKSKGWLGPVLMWQYASDGDVDNDGTPDGKKYGTGNTFLDLNVWLKSEAEYRAFTGGNVLLDIKPLSQRDPRWAGIKLGTSSSTIGAYGCLMTDATMLLRFLLGIDITPADLNAWLIANGGYHSGNLFVWAILNKYDPRVSFGYRYEYAALDKIDEQLAKGIPVIIHVDGIPASSIIDEHWVLVVGKENGQYIINDPIDGVQFPFNNRYGDPRSKIYIVCTYNFTGTVPPPVVIPPVEEDMLYQVKVKITNLVVRSGPGAVYPIVKRYATGILPIYEEKNGYGRIAVGQWVSLSPDYVEKLDERLDILWGWYLETHEA